MVAFYFVREFTDSIIELNEVHVLKCVTFTFTKKLIRLGEYHVIYSVKYLFCWEIFLVGIFRKKEPE